ncbi:MAG: DNA methylase [Parasporobacterium sp.]|nr:DNA methylase [Parasporobacterium sp.]
MNRSFLAIDMKSFYASVECVSRGLDPLTANLLVADTSRSDKTICLAVSPALKAIGVPARPRLFEARQAIRRYESLHHTKVNYITAVPRMAEYIRVSAKIYSVYLRHVAPEDVHVYSIDESFIDCTEYLHFYEEEARRSRQSPSHVMAMHIIRDVLKETGITATAGIGTNLYLAKVCMDIIAKKAPADRDGVRIAELDEDSYKFLLWDHKKLTDFWMIGRGKARRLQAAGMYTMGDVAQRSQWNEEWFYKTFGIDGELIVDHAWGVEPVTIREIRQFRPVSRSLSSGQVLPRPYSFEEARLIMKEMIENLCMDLVARNQISDTFSWWVGYDYTSLTEVPSYQGPLAIDFYGRLHPAHSGGTVRTPERTSSFPQILQKLLPQFDAKTDHSLLFRRLYVCADKTADNDLYYQLSFFTDQRQQEKERRLRLAMLQIRRRFGPNAIFKGMNLLKGGTALERSRQIGGHKA